MAWYEGGEAGWLDDVMVWAEQHFNYVTAAVGSAAMFQFRSCKHVLNENLQARAPRPTQPTTHYTHTLHGFYRLVCCSLSCGDAHL